jgi:hypothetical protein
MMKGLMVLGLSRPSGPTIFGHQAPRAPWERARARASGKWLRYQDMLRSRSSG